MCLDPAELIDGSDHARKVIEAVQQTGSRFGAGYLADVLLGQLTDKGQMHGRQNAHDAHDEEISSGFFKESAWATAPIFFVKKTSPAATFTRQRGPREDRVLA